MRKIGAPGLLLISPLWRNPGRLVENTPHLQDNRHFLFYPVSFPANKLHNKILFAKSALFGVGIGISRFCIFTEATHGIPKAVIGIGICLLAAFYHMVMALHIDGEDEGAEEK